MPQREAPLPLHILLVEDSEHDVLAFQQFPESNRTQ